MAWPSQTGISWPSGVRPASPPVELLLAKEDFKFNAAHFVVHEAARERLHGHNYRVFLSLRGASPSASAGGYLLDFGPLKATVRGLCAALDGRFLLPTRNPHLSVCREGGHVALMPACDSSRFLLPEDDVLPLPIANVTVEALAELLAARFLEAVGVQTLRAHGVSHVALGVGEAPGQEAVWRLDLGEAAGEDVSPVTPGAHAVEDGGWARASTESGCAAGHGSEASL